VVSKNVHSHLLLLRFTYIRKIRACVEVRKVDYR
jgi:hypothetical protein